MRRIYVAMEALQCSSEEPDAYLHTGIAKYARPFLTWAAEHGKVVLLTHDSLQHAMYLLHKLNCTDKASVKAFDLCKTEHLSSADDLYLVDTMLTPSETSWFAEHNLADRVVAVSMGDGVTPATKSALESKFSKPKKHP